MSLRTLSLDLAYTIFSGIWLAICAFWIVAILPVDDDTSLALAWAVMLPATMGIPLVAAAALVLSLTNWREWPLLMVWAVNASMLLVFLAEDHWKLVSPNFAIAWYMGSSAVVVFFCIRWFAFARRRNRSDGSRIDEL